MRTLYKSARLIFVIKTNTVTLSSLSCQDLHSLRKTSNLRGTKPCPWWDWAQADQQHLTWLDWPQSQLSLNSFHLSLSMSPARRGEVREGWTVLTVPSTLTTQSGERGLTVHCLDYQSISQQRNVNKISSWGAGGGVLSSLWTNIDHLNRASWMWMRESER